MKQFKFKKINAFATEKSDGNPAGMVILNDSDNISNDEMLLIAKELKGFVSEVGYVKQIDKNTFDLKYYSSEREVDFCGHATIAIMYNLIKNSNEFIKEKHFNIITQKGKLEVENRINQENAVYISAPQPKFSTEKISPDSIAESLKIGSNEIDDSYPVSIVNAGLETLIVPIKTLKGIISISPNLEELNNFCTHNGIDIIIVYSQDVVNTQNKFRTRVFAPTFGYLEDPATGSGNSALGYYLIKNKIWDGAPMSIEQNGDIEYSNIIKLKAKNTKSQKYKVVFGGGAVVKIEGAYFL
jgi:PhzF family phenazine biosynthesis protein|tara:strand:- start:1447 stop:2340 length:894 start_codon:yes stop_codon:yes gene_type:complete